MKLNKKKILSVLLIGFISHAVYAEDVNTKNDKKMKANDIIYENRKIVLDTDLVLVTENTKDLDVQVELSEKSNIFFKSDITIKNSVLTNLLSSISVKEDVTLVENNALITGAKVVGKKALSTEDSAVREVKLLMHLDKQTSNVYTHVFLKDAKSIKKEEGIIASVEKNTVAVTAEKSPQDIDNYNEYLLVHKLNKPVLFEVDNIKFNITAKFN